MFGQYFYHERIRRSVASFGSLFNNIYVLRKQASGNVASQVRVPLSYAPKRKYLERLQEDLENSTKSDLHIIALTLPRMSFEITGINYDVSRQLPKMNARVALGTTINDRAKIYTKTPYNIQFQLNVYGKTQDDLLQIVEQIIPYFTPQYTLSVKPLDNYPQIIDDIPLILMGISFSDDYEGAMETRRTIVYTLDFEMKMDFYGPIADSSIIREVDITTFLNDDVSATGWQKYSTLKVVPDPIDVSPDSDHTFIETITFARDSDA